MSQKATLLRLFKDRKELTKDEIQTEGVKHPRQQVYFLRKDGYNIINTGKQKYQLLK